MGELLRTKNGSRLDYGLMAHPENPDKKLVVSYDADFGLRNVHGVHVKTHYDEPNGRQSGTEFIKFQSFPLSVGVPPSDCWYEVKPLPKESAKRLLDLLRTGLEQKKQ